MMSFVCFGGNKQVKQSDTSALEAEVHRLDEELLARKICIERQDRELQARQQRIKELEGTLQLQRTIESLSSAVHHQQAQHEAASEAQHRQLHAFNLALLEQAEELAALQALLGAPSKRRQASRKRVTEDLETSLSGVQVPDDADASDGEAVLPSKPQALRTISEATTDA